MTLSFSQQFVLCFSAVLCAIGPAKAQEPESVTLALSGYVKPVCTFVGNAAASITVDIDDIGESVVFDAPINCNTPFDYSISAVSGNLSSDFRAQTGFQTEIPYTLTVDFGAEGGQETLRNCAAQPCTGAADLSSGARLTFSIPDASLLASGRKPLIAAAYAEGVTIRISARM